MIHSLLYKLDEYNILNQTGYHQKGVLLMILDFPESDLPSLAIFD